MAKSSKIDEEFDTEPSASDEDLKTGANSEEDEEELEAVARTASPDDEVGEGDDSQSTEDDRAVADADEDEADDPSAGTQIGRREKARLREMQRMKRQKIKEILDEQNAAIDADMNNKGKGRLKYLLQQTEIFAHFAQGSRSASEKKPKGRHDFQFFNTKRLSELYEKEVGCLMQAHQKNHVKDTNSDGEEPEDLGEPLTAEEQEEKDLLLEEGFSTWTRRDFSTFIQACEKYGRTDIKSIASEMEGKTEEEVERYAKVFKERYKELNDYDRIIKNIERGEARISRKDEIMKAIGKKLDRYKNPWLELKIQYGQNKGKLYNEECDRFMLCMVHKLGYGNWDELKAAFCTSPLFHFDWFVKSRTTQELARRCDTLIRLVEKENQEFDERERQARKDKKLAKNLTPTKRSIAKTSAPESPAPTSFKKRKQSSMDDFVSSGRRKK